jgi:hypothetical protein
MDIETFFRDHASSEVLFMYSAKKDPNPDLVKFLDDLGSRHRVTVIKKSTRQQSWYDRSNYNFIFKMRYDGVIVADSNKLTDDKEFTSGYSKKLAIKRLRIRAERAANRS